MKYEISAMLRQGKGSIVNISSSYGKVGGPTAAVYVGSKACRRRHHEVCGYRTRRNRRSCQHRWPWSDGNGDVQPLCANAGKQSKFPRGTHSYQAHGTPEEIANAIVFIGSDKASYIIGASLAVDGGMLAG